MHTPHCAHIRLSTLHIYHNYCQAHPHIEVYVQLSKSISDDSKFIQSTCKQIDQQPQQRSRISNPIERVVHGVQTLYACTGCDYVSFFQGMGKFLFFRYMLTLYLEQITRRTLLN